MKNLITLLLLVSLIFSVNLLRAQKTWTGTTSTSWNTSTNWSPSGIPTSSDNVIVPSAPANQPLLSGATGECNNLTVNPGATLTISATSLNNATLTISGTATMNGGLSIGGVLSKTGKLIVSNIVWASSSSMSGFLNGTIEVSGNWEFSTGSSVSMGYCGVTFTGSTNSNIVSKSSNSSFSSLTNGKNSGSSVTLAATSTSSLKISGSLILNAGTKLYGEANITTILESSLTNAGNFYFNAGTVSMEKSSGTQVIQTNSGDYFNALKINGGSTVTLSNNVFIHDDLTIQAGTFDPANYTVNVGGDWINTAGPAYFIEGTGKVVFYVIINKKGATAFDNNCNYSENFNILEMNNEGGYLVINNPSATVTCNQYDYTAGGIKVQAGTFTALDLADNGIFGYYGVQTGGTINLTNTGGYIDLSGSLNIAGGNFNVNGGLDQSYWPYNNNSSITMSGGILDFVDKGINISASTLVLTTNITGGTIRTSGGFTNNRSDFNPAGGTIELYGTIDASLTMNAGSTRNLTVNKTSPTNLVTLATNATVNGVLTIQGGILKATNKVLATGDNININSGGTLWIENGGGMLVTGAKALTVNEGGTLKVIGLSTNKSTISKNGTTTAHEFHVHGNISAKYAIFEYNYGINISSTAIVDPLYPFDQCTFQNGFDRFLFIGNSQEITIRNANFPTVPLAENVWKNNNAGRVTFRDATGAYAGSAYEADPYNRIDWIASQPGLWTGAVSASWFATGNWDDLTIPTSSTNVTIPTGTQYMPVLSSGTATCNNLTLNGTLTVRNAINQVSGNMAINGILNMNNASGQLIVQGNVDWNAGSTAAITANTTIDVYGDWNFNAGATAQLGNGSVYFLGTTNKSIKCYSATCSFWNLITNKTGLAITEFSNLSSQPLYINGSLTTVVNSKFVSSSNQTIHIKGNISSSGILQCNAGRINLNGSSQVIMPNTSDYYNNLDFNQSGTVTINNTFTNILNLKGGISILSGVFDGGSNIIKIGSSWYNPAGSDAFLEGTSRVIFNGPNDQDIFSEVFNILEVNKTTGGLFISGDEVRCMTFDWTNGLIYVENNNVLTINDLADNGIFGNYSVQSGGVINFHQDVSQNTGLSGNLEILSGGTVNVYGGNGWSQWPLGANASLHMTDGTLDFQDRGINISTTTPYSLTTDITGGTIRTSTGFSCNRTDFNPVGGTLELYGPNTANLEVSAGSLRNLTINKPMPVYLLSDATINGVININDGTLKATNRVISTGDHINVNDGGTLWLENGTVLKVTGNKALTVNQGGLLKVFGTPGSKPIITRNGATPAHEFHVNGTISAKNAIFEYNYGIGVSATGMIDPVYPLDSCTFQNGIDKYIYVINNQDLVIRAANFANASIGDNVWKTNDAGHISFKDATGSFAGPSYEYDPYNRIDWSASQPGLWTGLVSTDWHTAGNWDDLKVPTSSTDVTIPSAAPNMPAVSSTTANCNNLTIDGVLTIQNKTVNVNGEVNINGELAISNYLGKLEVQGDMHWNNGSSANISANAPIILFGDWTFGAGANAHINNGSVIFRGTESKIISVWSDNCTFNDVYIEKTGNASVTFDINSTEAMITKGLYVNPDAQLTSQSIKDIIATGNVYSFGLIALNPTALTFEGNDHVFLPNVNDYYGALVFSQTGTVTINQTNTNTVNVKGSVVFNSGVFSPGNSILKVGYTWWNKIGPAAFEEGSSRVIFNGIWPQYCSTEQFNILEIDKSAEYFYSGSHSTISCQVYDWTQGGIWIDGTSTFYAADLADNGIYGEFVMYGNSVELHQDLSQGVDLLGTLDIHSGTFKVYGGNDQSRWGYNGNASLTMSEGTLDFVDQGISIQNNSPNSFTSTITGGVIRTQKGFLVQSPGFYPSGGAAELYGNQLSMVMTNNGGGFYNLAINKIDPMGKVTINSSLVRGNVAVDGGLAEVPYGQLLECRGDIDVNNGGWLAVTSGSVKMGNLRAININSGGYLTSEGYEGAPSTFTSNYPSSFYAFNLNSGAELLMYHTVVERVSEQGLYIAPGAIVNHWNIFKNCVFRNGKSGPNPLLNIDNDQDMVIENATFTSTLSGGQYNVRKSVNSGNVTFVSFSGAFAGESFEDDPYSRINWVTTKFLNLSSVMIEGLYDGSETMRQAFDEMGPHWPSGVSDSITVELHNASAYGTIEYTAWGVSLSTGGEAIVPVPLDKTASYYITVKHRNGIETTSALPVDFSGTDVSYAFNTPEKAYGNNLGLMIDGVAVIFSGDSNQDGIVDGTDLSDIENLATNAASGYIPEDLNGDGLIDGSDLSIAGNNADQAIGLLLPE